MTAAGVRRPSLCRRSNTGKDVSAPITSSGRPHRAGVRDPPPQPAAWIVLARRLWGRSLASGLLRQLAQQAVLRAEPVVDGDA